MPTNDRPTNDRPSDDAPPPSADVDLAVVVGRLSSDPVVTTLASGTTLHRYEVSVRLPHGTDTVPVVTFDAARPPAVTAGDRVAAVGRVRRRFFRAGGATRSATEVVATSVTRDGRNRKVVRALEDAVAAVAGGPERAET
jgi:single-strand DNA-binding protein